MGGGSCAVGSVCSLWPHPSSGGSPHIPPEPPAAGGVSADFLWDRVPSTAPISLSSAPSVHRSHVFTPRAALAWTWGSEGSVVGVITGLDNGVLLLATPPKAAAEDLRFGDRGGRQLS